MEQYDAQILSDRDHNVSEISFEEDKVSEGEKEPISGQVTLYDAKNIGGGKMLSWGTGYQFGLKQGYQSPEEKQREKAFWENHK